jgi:hypothetical protein
MAAVDQVLTEIARELAGVAEKRLLLLTYEADELKEQLKATGADCAAARLEMKRLPSFNAKAAENYLCPRCYIIDGRRSPLQSVMCTRDEEFFRCDHLHEIAVPYG